jgi:hypothetical protein
MAVTDCSIVAVVDDDYRAPSGRTVPITTLTPLSVIEVQKRFSPPVSRV